MIDHQLSAEHTYRGSKAICHHHKEALCRVTNTEVCFLIYKEAAADVEEVEGYTIDYHRKYDEGEARTWVADGKEAKAQCPGKHGHEHHFLNAKTTQAERNEQDAKRFTHLADRCHNDAILHHQ